jgi:hypothetical protein
MKRTLIFALLSAGLAACNSDQLAAGGHAQGHAGSGTSPNGQDQDKDKNGDQAKNGADATPGDGTELGQVAGGGNGTDSAGNTAELQQNDAQFSCQKGQPGYVGKVYRLAPDTPALPNLDAMTPIGQLDAPQLDVPQRAFTAGFPGVPNLVEWFAIQFSAQLEVPETGVYTFKTTSDDGSKLYIGPTLVLVNDGIHGPADAESTPVNLEKGKRVIKIEWFQGPRDLIAPQVFWKRPGSGAFEIIPATALQHGKDCNLQDLGSFN